MMSRLVTRFAPSPTGLLHLGHAFSTLTAHRAAQSAGGRFLLRIEDIDRTRCRLGFETAIYEDLDWLELDWEEPVRRQSDHFDDYAAALEPLREKGVVYRCFRTRKEILDEIASAPHLSEDPGVGQREVSLELSGLQTDPHLAFIALQRDQGAGVENEAHADFALPVAC